MVSPCSKGLACAPVRLCAYPLGTGRPSMSLARLPMFPMSPRACAGPKGSEEGDMEAHQRSRHARAIDRSLSPGGPARTSTADPSATLRLRALLAHPAKMAAVFWEGGGALVAALAIFSAKWSPGQEITLLAIAGLACLGGAVHLLVGARMPRWGLHLGAMLAVVIVTASVGAGGRQVDLGALYVWVVVYAALFFSPRATAVYVGAVAVAYGVLLGIDYDIANPLAAWLAISGTCSLAGAVVASLVYVLRQDAREDSLTGLANRRAWDDRIEQEIERARRSGVELSVAMIDLDDFKAVNDRHGHEAGNALLKEVAACWCKAVRANGDFLARLGGDEFVLLAPGSGAMGIRRLVERLAEVAPEGITYSVGVATWSNDETAGDLLRRADHAMYQDKLGRRGRLRAKLRR